MGSMTWVQILDEAVWLSLHANALGKGMKLSSFTLSYGKIVCIYSGFDSMAIFGGVETKESRLPYYLQEKKTDGFLPLKGH